MRKFLPTAFVISVSGLTGVLFILWYQSWQEIDQASQQQASLIHTINEQNQLQEIKNVDRMESMFWEIQDEIENENKRDNEGLIDTLNLVRKRTSALIQKEGIDMEDLLNWREEQLKLLDDGGIFFQHWVTGQESPFDVPQKKSENTPTEHPFIIPEESILPAQIRHRLLNWEEKVFSYFNSRLGSTKCGWDPLVELIIPHELVVPAESFFIADLRMATEAVVPSSYGFEKVTYHTNLGEIIIKPGEGVPQLMISTHGLLGTEEQERTVKFVLTARMHRPMESGGVWEYPVEHSLRVVRLASE